MKKTSILIMILLMFVGCKHSLVDVSNKNETNVKESGSTTSNKDNVDKENKVVKTPLIVASGLNTAAIDNKKIENIGDYNMDAGSSPIISGHIQTLYPIGVKGHKGHIVPIKPMGTTPLIQASQSGKLEVVKDLLKSGADVDEEEENIKGKTALMYASEEGNLEVVKELLVGGAQVDKSTFADPPNNAWAYFPVNLDMTSLMYASRHGHLEVVKELLEAGANVEKGSKYNGTPLAVASENGHLEVVKELLKTGANIEKTEAKFRSTPLNRASGHGHIEVVKELLKAGASIEKATKYSWTPLMDAAFDGHLEVVKELLKAGADINKMNKEGKTALNLAKSNRHTEIVKYLEEYIKNN